MAKFGFTSVISADWSPLNNAIKEIDRESKKLNTELASINKALKFDPDNAVLAAQKLEVMGDSAKEAEKKLEVLRSQQEAMNKALEKGDISSDYYRQYQREIEKAEKAVSDFNKEQEKSSKTSLNIESLKNGLGTAAKAAGVATAAVGAFTGACAAAGKAVFDMAKESAAAGDKIDKQSQRLGMSAEAYQEWDYVLSQSGGSIDTLTTGINKLNNLLDDAKNGSESAAETFQRLGLSVDDIASMSQEERFNALITALQGMEDESERNAVANDILGKSYTNIIPLLNSTAEGTEALKQKAHDNNMIMSDESVAAAVAYTDAMDTLQRSVTGFTNELGAQMLPGLTEIIKGITDVASEAEGGSERIAEGAQMIADAFAESAPAVTELITSMVGELVKAAPQAVDGIMGAVTAILPSLSDAAVGIVTALIEGITSAFPEIGECAVDIVTKLVDALAEALPTLVQGAADLVTAVANGIADALPTLIPTAVEMIMSIVQVLADNVNLIVDAGINLIGGLAEGLIKALPELGKAIPQLMISLNTAIIAAIPQLLTVVPEIAKSFGEAASEINWSETSDQMIKGIVDGLTDGLGRIKEACRRLMDAIKGMLGFDSDDGHTSGSFGGVTAEDISAGSGIKELQDSLWDEASAVEEAVTEYGQMSKSAAEFMAETAKGNAEVIKKAEKQAAEDAKKAREEAWGAVVSSLDDLDSELAKHKLSEGEYWEKRKALLEENRDEESAEWWKYYDEVTAYYNKLAETESKEREAALKEQTADAKERFDALYKELSDEEITRKEFNDRYAALTEELANKRIDISEYAADKIAEYDKKVREEELGAWEKSSKEITSSITKTYENVTKAYEKAKSQLISSASLIEDKVTDTSGADRYILTDFEQKRRELAKYRKSLEKLKDTGISDELMEQVMSLSYDNGDRQGYISELLKMSDKQRQAYYKDVEAFYAEAEAAARDEVQPELDEADRIAKEGIDKIYGDMPEGAYQKGVDTALAYIEGINDAMSDAGSLMSMGSDYGERSNNAKLQSAAKDMKEIAAYASGGGNYYSENTVISVSVAGKEIIKSTLKELARSKQLADGR